MVRVARWDLIIFGTIVVHLVLFPLDVHVIVMLWCTQLWHLYLFFGNLVWYLYLVFLLKEDLFFRFHLFILYNYLVVLASVPYTESFLMFLDGNSKKWVVICFFRALGRFMQ